MKQGGKGVSRRDFLKDVAGGAMGAAIISTQLIDPSRVEAATKLRIAARQPSQQLKDKWKIIREVTKKVLTDFKGLEAKQVNLRLNESSKDEPSPVFIDWLAVDEVSERLDRQSGTPKVKHDWGLYRLGDGLVSDVYREAVKNARKITTRDWSNSDRLKKEKTVESQQLVLKAGLKYQSFIGIIAADGRKSRCVGLLTVSFETEPKPDKVKKIEDRMTYWATNPKSELVNKIKENFVLGGPEVKAA